MGRRANKRSLTEEQRRLVEAYMPLAIAEARKASHLRLDTQERVSAAFEGLCRAALSFRVDSGVKFSTYAIYTIRQTMSRIGVNEGHLIRIPEHLLGAGRARANPLCVAAADRLICAAKESIYDHEAVSPDSPLDRLEADEENARLLAAIEGLPHTPREVVKDRLAGLSATRSAARLGISMQLLANHLNRGVALLRQALTTKGDAA